MASVNGIRLDHSSNFTVRRAVAFRLSRPATRGRTYTRSDGAWDAQLKSGSAYVVARTILEAHDSQLIDHGLEAAHSVLDLASVVDRDNLTTHQPISHNIQFEAREGRPVVRFSGIGKVGFDAAMSISVASADGAPIPAPMAPAPEWRRSYRYYRLAQTSTDLADAYRHLYLALEAALSALTAKTHRERDWLREAVRVNADPAFLAGLAPARSTNPLEAVVGRIYSSRNQIFHAGSRDSLLPGEQGSYPRLARAFENLVLLWQHIVDRHFQPRRRGGAMLSESVFAEMLLKQAGKLNLCATGDDTLLDGSSSDLSPKGLPVVHFAQPVAIREARPGVVVCQATIPAPELNDVGSVGRIMLAADRSTLFMGDHVPGGVTLEDVSEIEAVFEIRLANSGKPKLDFI